MTEFESIEKAVILNVKAKIKEKLASIYNDPGFNKLPTNWTGDAFLTGGAIASLIQGEEPGDWDIYFKDVETQAWFAQNHKRYEAGIKDVDAKYHDVLGMDGKWVTSRAITMKNGISFIIMGDMFGSPAKVRQSFDYVHCMPWYDLFNDKLYISKLQFHACVKKLLIVNNPSVIKPYREEKFKERGYTKGY